MSNRPSLEEGTKEILRVAVQDLHLSADAMINAQPILERFNNLPWKVTDLRPALIHAQEKGWITQDGRLTAASLAAAPAI